MSTPATVGDDLVELLRYRVNNPSAWEAFEQMGSDLFAEAASQLAAVTAENERLRYDNSDLLADADASAFVIRTMSDRATAAEAQLKAAREALEPFAEYMKDGGDLNNKGEPLPDEAGVGWVYLTQGDFRRARAALNPKAAEVDGPKPS